MRKFVHFFVATLIAVISQQSVARALEPGKVDAIGKAAEAFVALAKDSHRTGNPPRETDATARRLLDLVLDTAEIESGKPVPWSQLMSLNNWNQAAVKIGLVYLLAGTGATDIAALNNDPGAAEKVNGNTSKFAPELGRYFDAQLRLQGAIADTVQQFLGTASRAQLENPQFKSGLGQIRSGLTQTVNGLLSTLVVDGVTDEWRRARLAVVIGVAPKMARFLPREQAASIGEIAQEVAGHLRDQAAKNALAEIVKTMTAK